MRTLQWTITLAADPGDLWAFHIDPRNAAKIAPPWPKVQVIRAQPFSGIGDSFVFRMKFGPIGILWEGRIVAWEPPHAFTDEQVRGPFKMFRHTHRIEQADEGSCLTDSVTYAMRGGPLASVIDAIHGRRALEQMFAYRHRALREIFGSDENVSEVRGA